MSLGRAIWTLDDLQTVADNGLSPARRRGMADAILARLGHPETADAREWRGRSLLELGRLALEARGIRLGGVDRMKIVGYALGMQREGPHGFLSTSDFPTQLATTSPSTIGDETAADHRAPMNAPEGLAGQSGTRPAQDW